MLEKKIVRRRDRKKTDGFKWSMHENRKEKERWWIKRQEHATKWQITQRPELSSSLSPAGCDWKPGEREGVWRKKRIESRTVENVTGMKR